MKFFRTYALVICLLFCFCHKPESNYRQEKLSDKFTIKVPDNFVRNTAGSWYTRQDELLYSDFKITSIKQQNLDFQDILQKSNWAIDNDFVKKDSINFNGFNCVVYFYKKNYNPTELQSIKTILNKMQNKTFTPVHLYFVYAVVQTKNEILTFKGSSLNPNSFDIYKQVLTSISYEK